jgi:hypothetical protein
MNFKTVAAITAASMVVGACATSYTVTPQAGPNQEIRYLQGQATTYSDLQNGAVQITPLGVNQQGRLVFGVAAFNETDQASNFGIENVSAAANGEPLRIFTHAEMERQAKNAATAALIVAAVAGAASAYAAQQNATTTSTYTTPRGVYTYRHYNPLAAQLGVSVAAAGTAATTVGIAKTLDATLEGLSATVLQTTTIDPDEAFGGQVTTDRVSVPSNGSLAAMLSVTWNGETHLFNWNVTKAQ